MIEFIFNHGLQQDCRAIPQTLLQSNHSLRTLSSLSRILWTLFSVFSVSVTLFADSCEANVTRVSTIRAIHFTATLKHNRQANPKKAHHYFNSSKNLRDVVIKTQERLCWRRRLESRTAQSLVNIHSCPKALDVLAARNGNSLIKIQHFVVGVNPVASTVL